MLMRTDASTPDDIDHSAAHKPSRRLLYLDGWRGLCIITVLLGHFLPIHAIDLGDLGVEMFFVLSGRLMADILFVERFPLPQFYLRRFSRVWPGLAVYVGFCFIAFSTMRGFLHVTPAAAVAALLFLTNYRVMLLGESQLLDHTWSLSVEEHSYLALGLVAFLLRNRSLTFVKRVILGLALAMAAHGLIAAYVFPTHQLLFPARPGGYPAVYFDVYWRSDIRAASVFIAAFVYLHFFTRGNADVPRLLCLALAFIGVLAFAAAGPRGLYYIVGTLCLAITVCALDGAQNPFRAMMQNKVLVAFGTWSFSIYIWQQLFYKLFQLMRDDGILTPMTGVIFRPAFVIAACGAGVLSFYFVEKPARRYINKRIEARAEAAAMRRRRKADGPILDDSAG